MSIHDHATQPLFSSEGEDPILEGPAELLHIVALLNAAKGAFKQSYHLFKDHDDPQKLEWYATGMQAFKRNYLTICEISRRLSQEKRVQATQAAREKEHHLCANGTTLPL